MILRNWDSFYVSHVSQRLDGQCLRWRSILHSKREYVIQGPPSVSEEPIFVILGLYGGKALLSCIG